jgi:hypothetical protein
MGERLGEENMSKNGLPSRILVPPVLEEEMPEDSLFDSGTIPAAGYTGRPLYGKVPLRVSPTAVSKLRVEERPWREERAPKPETGKDVKAESRETRKKVPLAKPEVKF